MDLENLKFPAGHYVSKKDPESSLINQWIDEIECFPGTLKDIVDEMPGEAVNWKYRPNGWTVKQVVHHCADSHMNSIIRFKLALTEDTPTIRPYYEDRWAQLVDSQSEDLSASLSLLEGLHKRWVLLLRGLTPKQLKLEFMHPEHGTKTNLADCIGSYAWHCRHHLGHVQNGIKSEGQYN